MGEATNATVRMQEYGGNANAADGTLPKSFGFISSIRLAEGP